LPFSSVYSSCLSLGGLNANTISLIQALKISKP